VSDKVTESTYHIRKRNGEEMRITVPSSWKVTYGPIAPGSKSLYDANGAGGCALRFYEAENKQRACFRDVESFHDLSLDIKIKKREVDECLDLVKSDKRVDKRHNVSINETWEQV